MAAVGVRCTSIEVDVLQEGTLAGGCADTKVLR